MNRPENQHIPDTLPIGSGELHRWIIPTQYFHPIEVGPLGRVYNLFRGDQFRERSRSLIAEDHVLLSRKRLGIHRLIDEK